MKWQLADTLTPKNTWGKKIKENLSHLILKKTKQQQQNHKRKNTACVIQCSFMENRSTSNKPDLVSKF